MQAFRPSTSGQTCGPMSLAQLSRSPASAGTGPVSFRRSQDGDSPSLPARPSRVGGFGRFNGFRNLACRLHQTPGAGTPGPSRPRRLGIRALAGIPGGVRPERPCAQSSSARRPSQGDRPRAAWAHQPVNQSLGRPLSPTKSASCLATQPLPRLAGTSDNLLARHRPPVNKTCVVELPDKFGGVESNDATA